MPVAPIVFDEQEYGTISWVGETGTGLKAEIARFSDITVQATGTGTVTVEGSIDGVNWVLLNDTSGAVLSLAAASNEMAVLLEHPFYIRPVVTGGTANVRALTAGNR